MKRMIWFRVILKKMKEFCKSIGSDVRSEENLIIWGDFFKKSDLPEEEDYLEEIITAISQMIDSLRNNKDTVSAIKYLVKLSRDIIDHWQQVSFSPVVEALYLAITNRENFMINERTEPLKVIGGSLPERFKSLDWVEYLHLVYPNLENEKPKGFRYGNAICHIVEDMLPRRTEGKFLYICLKYNHIYIHFIFYRPDNHTKVFLAESKLYPLRDEELFEMTASNLYSWPFEGVESELGKINSGQQNLFCFHKIKILNGIGSTYITNGKVKTKLLRDTEDKYLCEYRMLIV